MTQETSDLCDYTVEFLENIDELIPKAKEILFIKLVFSFCNKYFHLLETKYLDGRIR